MARDNLPNKAVIPVRTNDDVRIEHPTILQAYCGRFSVFVEPNTLDFCAKVDLHALGSGELEEHLVDVVVLEIWGEN